MLQVNGLTKIYGKHKALDNLTFEVNPGEIVGLLGPNGAGKTTALRSITGILRIASGKVLVNGFDLQTHELQAKSALAFVPEQPYPYEDLTVREHIYFVALCYKTVDDFDRRLNELLQVFELEEKRDSLVASLSKGMRQKLMLACALIHDPKVLLLGEPLIGLDPHSQRELKTQLMRARDEGRSVLVSTHQLDTAEALCDRLVILQKGQTLAQGTLAELRARANSTEEASLEDVFITLTKESAEMSATAKE